jgi:hypothetical protein
MISERNIRHDQKKKIRRNGEFSKNQAPYAKYTPWAVYLKTFLLLDTVRDPVKARPVTHCRFLDLPQGHPEKSDKKAGNLKPGKQ